MDFFVLAAQCQDQVSLLFGVYLGVVGLGRGSLLAGFELGEVLCCEQVQVDFVRLFSLHGSHEHLGEDLKFFVVACLVCNLFDVLLLEVPPPEETIKLAFAVDDHAEVGVKFGHFVD